MSLKEIGVEEMLGARINEEAVAIERVYFTKTDRTVNPKRESPFKYIPGTIPILVSAPHAVRHLRRKEIKKSDEYTGATACLLNRFTGCHVLAVTRLYGEDPNFDANSLYKDLLREICAANNIKVLLDLHGAAREREFAVDLGSMKGKALLGSQWLPGVIAGNLESQGIHRISREFFAAQKQDTVTKFASQELGIPAVQVEINKEFRVPRQNPEAYCRLLAALASCIGEIVKKLNC